MRKLLVVVALTSIALPAAAQGRIEHDIHFLASDTCAGREVGTEGHDRARDYIVEAMKAAGLDAAGTDGWYVPVRLIRSARPNREASLKLGETVLAEGHEYRISDFSDGVLVGPPIFLGYGLDAPQHGWTDYGLHDVRNRIVVAFTGAPPGVEERLPPEDRYLLTDESKAAIALSRGATGIVIINDPRSHGDGSGQRRDEIEAPRAAFPLAGIAAVRVTKRAALRAFARMSLDLAAYQENLDFGRPQSVEIAFDITGDVHLDREVITVHNVVGKLGDGEGPPIVLSAHYDHLGLGGPWSRYRGPPALHPGADDNASGVAVMLEVARRLRKIRTRRPVFVAALTGEERALRGSRTLARVFLDRRAPQGGTFLNLDMVGRLDDERLRAYVDPDSPALPRVLDGATRARLTIDQRPLTDAHSDHVPFAELGWDAIGFSSGRHSDYHRPTDTEDKLDWRGLHAITDFVTASVRLLATK